MTTFVLVPGAGGAAWYWSRVVPLLRAEGHRVRALDLPSDDSAVGLPEYAQLARAAVREAGRDDIVLAAQSLGGFTAAMTAGEVGVRAVVLVNAMIPVPGEKAGDWWANTGSQAARVDAARAGGYDTEFDIDTYFFHDVPAEVVQEGAAHDRDETDVIFQADCEFPGWPPNLHVVAGADDRFFPVDFQRRVAAERTGVAVDVLPGGHLMALSHPQPLARYLLSV